MPLSHSHALRRHLGTFGPRYGSSTPGVLVLPTRGTSKDAGLRVGGPVHRAIGIREKPDGPPRQFMPAPVRARRQTAPAAARDFRPCPEDRKRFTVPLAEEGTGHVRKDSRRG